MSVTERKFSGISHFQRSLIVVANVIQGVGVAHRRGWTLVTTIQYNLISWNSKLENHLSNRSEQGVKPETDELTTNSSICFCSKPRHGLQNDEVDCFAAWCRGKCKEKGSLCKLVGQRLWNESRDTYIVWHCLGIAFAYINLSSLKAFKKTSICTRNVWALRYTVGTAILLSLCEKVEEVFMYKKTYTRYDKVVSRNVFSQWEVAWKQMSARIITAHWKWMRTFENCIWPSRDRWWDCIVEEGRLVPFQFSGGHRTAFGSSVWRRAYSFWKQRYPEDVFCSRERL